MEKEAEVYYLLIRGPLAIGKSTIAKKLAKLLKAEYFSLDQILEKKGFDKINKKLGCIPAKNFIQVDKLILPKAISALNKGTIVIFDGCFYHKGQIEHLEKSLKSFKGLIFNLKAPVATCIARDSRRKNVYGKVAAKAVHKLVSKFDYGLNINTNNKTESRVIKEIKTKLFKLKWTKRQ